MLMILLVLALTLGCWFVMEAMFYLLGSVVRLFAFLLVVVLDV